MGKKLTDLGLVVGWCGVACVSLCFRDPAHCHMPKVENLWRKAHHTFSDRTHYLHIVSVPSKACCVFHLHIYPPKTNFSMFSQRNRLGAKFGKIGLYTWLLSDFKGLYDTHLDCLSEMIKSPFHAISIGSWFQTFHFSSDKPSPSFSVFLEAWAPRTLVRFQHLWAPQTVTFTGADSSEEEEVGDVKHAKCQGVKCWGMLRSGKVNVCREYMKVKCILSLSRILLFVLEKRQ